MQLNLEELGMYNMNRKVVLNQNYILIRFLDIFVTRMVNLTGIVQLKVVQYFGLGRRVSKGTAGGLSYIRRLLINISYNIYILLDGLVCSIEGYFYESRRILASP